MKIPGPSSWLALFLACCGSLCGADLDRDGIDDALEDELMIRFAPYVQLFPETTVVRPGAYDVPGDPYRPCSIDWFLSRVRLCYDVDDAGDVHLLEKGEVNKDSLLEQIHNGFPSRTDRQVPEDAKRFFLTAPDADEDTFRHGDPDPSRWECYSRVRIAAQSPVHFGEGDPDQLEYADGDYYHIAYMFFFAYSGEKAPGTAFFVAHEGDFERIVVAVRKDGLTINRVFFAAHEHEEGRWYTTPDLRLKNGRPVAYTASSSHAHYPFPGQWERSGKTDDHTADGGTEWDTRTGLGVVNVGEFAHPRPGSEWIQFAGRWGELGAELGALTGNGPYSPPLQDWWFTSHVDATFNEAGEGSALKPFGRLSHGVLQPTEIRIAPGDYGFTGTLALPMVLSVDEGTARGRGPVTIGGASEEKGRGHLRFWEDNDQGGTFLFEGIDGFPAGIPVQISVGDDNDEARSLDLRNVAPDTQVMLLDAGGQTYNPSFGFEGDFALITVKRLSPLILVNTFEADSFEDEDLRFSYSRQNGLDGKVSQVLVVANGPSDELFTFYEGNGATGQKRGRDLRRKAGASYNLKESNGSNIPNDEIRSLVLHNVRTGAELFLYDDPDGSTDNPYARIRVLKDIEREVVFSFENSYTNASVQVTKFHSGTLDGKVSRIEIRN